MGNERGGCGARGVLLVLFVMGVVSFSVLAGVEMSAGSVELLIGYVLGGSTVGFLAYILRNQSQVYFVDEEEEEPEPVQQIQILRPDGSSILLDRQTFKELPPPANSRSRKY